MKTNERRKVFDAVDLLTEETAVSVPAVKMKNGVTMLSIDSIKPFHDHPFRLYEGKKLSEMVDSVKEYGKLFNIPDTLLNTQNMGLLIKETDVIPVVWGRLQLQQK